MKLMKSTFVAILLQYFVSTLELTDSDSSVDESLDYIIADRIPIKDELLIEDEQLAIAHVDMDIRDFEELERTIAVLQNHITKHAFKHQVNQSQLQDASKALEDTYMRDVHPALLELKKVKKELVVAKPHLHNNTINQINEIVEKAEQFLHNAWSSVREVTQEDQNWDLEEEQQMLRDSFRPDSNFSQPLIQKIYIKSSNNSEAEDRLPPVQVSPGLKVSLENAKVALKKLKEEKSVRKESKRPSLRENVQIIKTEELDTEAFLKQLKEKLDEEERRRNLHPATDEAKHEVVNYKTKEALDTAKDDAHKFIDKVFHRKSDSQAKVKLILGQY